MLAAVNLIAVGLVAAPSQAQTVNCTGALSNQTITASVVVPAGAFCQLTDVTVDGRLDVLDSATLFAFSSRVIGPFGIGTFAHVETTDARIDGSTTLLGDASLYATRTRFGRLVDGQNSLVIDSTDSTHWGGIRSSGGENVVRGGFVIGSFFVSGATTGDLYDTAVFGPITVTNTQYGSVQCHIGAALSDTVSNSGGFVHIGISTLFGNCGFNLMSSLTVNDNIGADIQLTRNVIAGNLSCSGNDPGPHGELNLVGGSKSGQCASLTPAPSPASVTTEETRTAPRRENILLILEQRRDRVGL